MSLDRKSHIPFYIQIERKLRKMIEEKEYKEGKRLPGEVDLANKYNVSRNTVRQATNKLELEGLIVRKKGIGTFVSREKLSTQLSRWYSFSREMMDKGVSIEDLESHKEWVKANKLLADFFSIPLGSEILKLSRLIAIKGEPVIIFESYFNPRIKIDGKFDFQEPLYKYLEREFHIEAIKSNENITAKLAKNYYRRLRIKPNDPILVRERFVYGKDDQPIEYNMGYYRADKFTYSIEIFK